MRGLRVLVTGQRGKVGRVLVPELLRRGFEVAGFDIADGQDILDEAPLKQSLAGCEAVVHLAVAGIGAKPDNKLMAVNVQGTWNLLNAAKKAGIGRVVFMSSVNAIGVFRGDAPPAYLPIDDDHPATPRSAYGLSKRLGEEVCRYFAETAGMATICLRAPAVWDAEDYGIAASRRRWAYWEYGAFIDNRDLARAVVCALESPGAGHATLLVAAEDIETRGATSRELVTKLLPQVEWRGGPEYDTEPYRALVNTERARKLISWAPEHTWRAFHESPEWSVAVNRPPLLRRVIARLRRAGR